MKDRKGRIMYIISDSKGIACWYFLNYQDAEKQSKKMKCECPDKEFPIIFISVPLLKGMIDLMEWKGML